MGPSEPIGGVAILQYLTQSAGRPPTLRAAHTDESVLLTSSNTAVLEPTGSVPTTDSMPAAPAGPLFNDFDISQQLKDRLAKAGFVTPTPVQAKAIPPALEGRDVLATAATGTGKTLSCLIPMIDYMDNTPAPPPVQAGKRQVKPIRSLILLPTRELAMQVLEAYGKIVPNAKGDAVLVCGGLSEGAQLEALRRGPRLVVATP